MITRKRELKLDHETSATSADEKRKASDANQKPSQSVNTGMEVTLVPSKAIKFMKQGQKRVPAFFLKDYLYVYMASSEPLNFT